MPQDARERILRSAGILAQAAGLLDIPVYYSEQYPKGLGATHPELIANLPAGARRFEKTCFSCGGAEGFSPQTATRRQIVIVGMEAHVCVLQTALDLASGGIEVYVVEDAVCSRNPAHRENAMARLRHAGVVVTNTESVVFEWLIDSRNEHFKAISKLVR